MMGKGRTQEKGKADVSAGSFNEGNNDNANGVSSNTLFEENSEEDPYACLLDMAASFAEMKDFHWAAAHPETVSNLRGYTMNADSFQTPQENMSSNIVNTSHLGVSLLPDWNMNWDQQCVNQRQNGTSDGGESSFVSYNNRPQVNRENNGSSFLFHSRESAPVHTRNNVGFNQSHSGIQGDFEGSFLSLGIGGTEESVPRSQLGSREISDNVKDSTSNELKMGWPRKDMGQTLDADFSGFQGNNSGLTGFSSQFCHENRMTSTNNEDGFHGSLDSWLGSSPQQNVHMRQPDVQHGKNIRSGDLDHFRDDKLKEAVSTVLKKVHTQKPTGQTSGQSLNAGIMGFQSNTSGFSNQISNLDQMTSTKNDVGALSTLNTGLGTSPHRILQMPQNDSRNIRSGEFDRYRALISNQSVHSGTLGGISEQRQYVHSTTANNPSYAGQVTSRNATPNQVLGSNTFFQRTASSQVSRVDNVPTGIDEPFPKRLGVELNVRNSLQTNQRHLSPMGTSLQTTSTGRTDGAPVSYPANSQEPFFAHGQSQNAQIQLAKTPQGATSANASTVSGQSQKPDMHIRQHHKRSAVVPHPASRWVQRQKINHPTNHPSIPKPYIPVSTAQIHPVIPVGSPTQPAGHIAARVRPGIPSASNVRHRVPVTTAPAVSHITRKAPEATPKLSGYKCFLCKRDLALTSDGPVHQPTVPPPVAVLPCGHSFHDQCLQNITPDDQAKDPPCIPCAIGEQ